MALGIGTITNDIQGGNGAYTDVGAISHNNGGASLFLVLIMGQRTGSLVVTSPVYNSIPVTPIGQSDNTVTAGPSIWAGVLANPSSGANNFTATISQCRSTVVSLVPITGADLADIFQLHSTETVTNTAASQSFTDTTETNNSWHFLAGGVRDGTNAPPFTPGSGMTEDVEQASGPLGANDANLWLGHKLVAIAGSSTVAASWSSDERDAWMSFEIKEDTGGGPTGNPWNYYAQQAA